jgi:hypothetical protein
MQRKKPVKAGTVIALADAKNDVHGIVTSNTQFYNAVKNAECPTEQACIAEKSTCQNPEHKNLLPIVSKFAGALLSVPPDEFLYANIIVVDDFEGPTDTRTGRLNMNGKGNFGPNR